MNRIELFDLIDPNKTTRLTRHIEIGSPVYWDASRWEATYHDSVFSKRFIMGEIISYNSDTICVWIHHTQNIQFIRRSDRVKLEFFLSKAEWQVWAENEYKDRI